MKGIKLISPVLLTTCLSYPASVFATDYNGTVGNTITSEVIIALQS